jgi:hypothetical protein
MQTAIGGMEMAKKRKKPEPAAEAERVSLINLKGTSEERAFLRDLSRKTGVPIATIVRRGAALWAASRGGSLQAPADWIEEQ